MMQSDDTERLPQLAVENSARPTLDSAATAPLGANRRQQQRRDLTSFDPLSPWNPSSANQDLPSTSLLDSMDEEEAHVQTTMSNSPSSNSTRNIPSRKRLQIPGNAGYLEMEEEPPRSPLYSIHQSTAPSPYDPIKTSSGLLLTHRKTPPAVPRLQARHLHAAAATDDDDDDDLKKGYKPHNLFGGGGGLKRERFQMEHAMYHSSQRHPGQQLLRYTRAWIALSALVLLVGTVVVVHHMRLESPSTVAENSMRQGLEVTAPTSGASLQEGPIVLLPLPENGGLQALQQQQQQQQPRQVALPDPILSQQQVQTQQQRGSRRLMSRKREQQQSQIHTPNLNHSLRHQFENWITQHGKTYHTLQEKEHRFQIWSDNHHRTLEKNRKHGPCRKTKQPVFGSNHLQDLSTQEFQTRYLTGYTGPTADREPPSRSVGVLGPHVVPKRHPHVHRKLQAFWQQQSGQARKQEGYFGTECDWYDVSCLLAYVFDTYFYGLGRTMEPKYDADSYPQAIDWRDVGAVGSVRAQGNCGACWAITAIETVESAVYIATQQMNELSETEVIVCADECEMCAGGWPQEAIEYVMDSGGVPLRNDVPYDGDWLLGLSDYKAGNANNDDFDAQTASSTASQMCSANSKSNSGSGDQQDNQDGGYSFARYGGEIEGYGYATKKCVCYTDGTGCKCNSQNEGMAVRNIATYGPAVVCFDASTWQDYAGGIITSASGCSQGFMDVNHCAQVVGYAYDSEGDDDEEGNKSGSADGEGSNDNDDGNRSGYWIVRNQWTSYWGMNGYAYVAMGENTCGILNDMLLAYT